MKVNVNEYGSTTANIECDDVELMATLIAVACGFEPNKPNDDGVSPYYKIKKRLTPTDGKPIAAFWFDECLITVVAA